MFLRSRSSVCTSTSSFYQSYINAELMRMESISQTEKASTEPLLSL